MPKPNIRVTIERDKTLVDVLSRIILAEICLSEAPRMFR